MQRAPYFVCLNKEQYETCSNITKAGLNGVVDIDFQDSGKMSLERCAEMVKEVFHSLRSTEPIFMKTFIKLMVLKELERNNVPPTFILDDIIQKKLRTVPYTLPFKVQETCGIVYHSVSIGPEYEVACFDEWHAMSIFAAFMETYIVETPNPFIFVNAVGLFATTMYHGFLATYRTYRNYHYKLQLAYQMKKNFAPSGVVPLPPPLESLPRPTEREKTEFTIIEAALVSAMEQITDKRITLPISCRITPEIAEATMNSLNIDVERVKKIMEAVEEPKYTEPSLPAFLSTLNNASPVATDLAGFRSPPSDPAINKDAVSPSMKDNSFASPNITFPLMAALNPLINTPMAIFDTQQANAAAIPPEMIRALLSGCSTTVPSTQLPVSSLSVSTMTSPGVSKPAKKATSKVPFYMPQPRRHSSKRLMDPKEAAEETDSDMRRLIDILGNQETIIQIDD